MTLSRTDRISARLFAEAGLFVWQRRTDFLLTGWVWMGALILLYTALGNAVMPLLTGPATDTEAASTEAIASFPTHLLALIAIATALLGYNWHNLVLGRSAHITLVSGWSLDALRYVAKMVLACIVLPLVAFVVVGLFVLPLIYGFGPDNASYVMLILAVIFLFYATARNLTLSAYILSGQPNPLTRSWKASGHILAVPAGCVTLVVLVSVLLNTGASIIAEGLRLISPDLAGFFVMIMGFFAQFVLLAWLVALSQRVYDWMFEGHYARIDA